MATASERLDLLLNGLIGAFNRWADRIGPANKDASIHQAITSGLTEIALRIAPGDEDSLSHNLAKWQSLQLDEIKAGFKLVAEAIANKQPPPPPGPKMKGTIMADFAIPDDTPDGRVTFAITATDAEGVPITDPAELAKLKFEVTGSNDDAFVVTLDADQPDPANRVGGYHVGAPGQAVLTENLSDPDGNIIATGSDGFTVTTGKVAMGAVKATFDGLTPIV